MAASLAALRNTLKPAIHFAFNPAGRSAGGTKKGAMQMRRSIALAGLALAGAAAAPAEAATIVILADPMTLERRTVLIDPSGPDRAYFCMLPPSQTGCQQVPFKRARRA